MLRPTAPLLALAWLASCASQPSTDPVGDDDVPDTTVDPPAACSTDALPPTPVHRLSQRELEHTVADVLGLDLTFDDLLVADDLRHGYDNQSDAQTFSTLHLERYQAAAARIADALLERGSTETLLEAEDLGLTQGDLYTNALSGEVTYWRFDNESMSFELPFDPPVAGTYTVTVRGHWSGGYHEDPDDTSPAPELRVYPADQDSSDFGQPLTSQDGTDEELSWTFSLSPDGPALRFHAHCSNRSEAAIDHLLFSGPAEGASSLDSPARAAWIPCEPADDLAACTTTVLDGLLPAAWRRPPTDAERDALLSLVLAVHDDGLDAEASLHLGLEAVFSSPAFLYRTPDLSELAPGQARALTPHELAARLSYLVWSSAPDANLRACAEAGAFHPDTPAEDPCSVASQVQRLLADPKADRLITSWGAQWLQLDRLDDFYRDPDAYPTADEALATSLRTETLSVLRDHRAQGRPWVELIDRSSTEVDPALAALYGIDHPGTGWHTVEQPDDRQGLLGHASILALTSSATRTSPIHRGLWVLDRLLCDPPDAPPANVPSFDEALEANPDATVPEVLALHRANATCAACHDDIDPVGLALEPYDALGASRTHWPDGHPMTVDAALPDGTQLGSPLDLVAALASDPAVGDCLDEQLFTWAMARAPVDADDCTLQALHTVHAEGQGLDGLVTALATSEAFTHVRAPAEDE